MELSAAEQHDRKAAELEAFPEEYEKLRYWAFSSIDALRRDLVVLCYPIFVHRFPYALLLIFSRLMDFILVMYLWYRKE